MNCDLPLLWSTCPPFTRFLILVGLFTTVLGFLTQTLLYLLSNMVWLTLGGEIWRIFTSWMVYYNFLDFLLSGILLFLYLYKEEKSYSTALLILDFYFQAFLLQLSLLLLFIIFQLFNINHHIFSCGTFPMVMFYFTRRYMLNPEAQSNQLCCPTTRNKFIPLIFVIILFIFSMKEDIVMAYLLALIQSVYFNHSFIPLTQSMALWLEGTFVFTLLFRSNSVVLNSGQGLGKNTGGLKNDEYEVFGQFRSDGRQRRENNEQFTAFKGQSRTMEQLRQM